MFSYYGSKSKIVKLYEKPLYNKIIEPFAGSARYSLEYWDKEIYLYDVNPVIINIWHYLQQTNEKEIRSLPLPEPNQEFCVDDYNLSQVEKDLLGFLIADGMAKPSKKVTKKWLSLRPNKINHRINNLVSILDKIKHWVIELKDFRLIENQKATWFIDPPYFKGGHIYPFKFNDYNYLKNWCMDRNGQIIVCENTNANWLPFQPLIKMKGANKITTEAVFYNESEQPNLF